MIEINALTLNILSTEQATAEWVKLAPIIMPALDYSPDLDIFDVERAVKNGQYHVIEVIRQDETVGAVVFNLQILKGVNTAFVIAISGYLIGHDNGFEKLKDLLRLIGVTRIQGLARPSVARLWSKLGVKIAYSIVEADI